jgi:hypothetical protein
MGSRFNPPLNWPTPQTGGWVPPQGWEPVQSSADVISAPHKNLQD